MADYTIGNLMLSIQTKSDDAVKSLDNLTNRLTSINGYITSITQRMAGFSKVVKSVSSTDVKWISSLSRRLATLNKKDTSAIASGFTELATALDPFLTKVQSAAEALKNLNAIMQKAGKASIVMTNVNQETLGKLGGMLDAQTKASLARAASYEARQAAAEKRASEPTKFSGALGKTLKVGWTIGKLYFLYNYTKRMMNVLKNAVQYAIDYQETLNMWQVAMRENLDLADEFITKMNRAYSVSEKTLMQYHATFKNMLSALGMISESSSYPISEALVQMALDYSSLYNTTMEKAMITFQAVLAGQVRPIRSISGYDITENTIYQLYESLGGTKTTRQLSQTEKRLLRILAVFKQMETSGALGDLSKTLSTSANQIRIMKEQSQELAMWAGQMVNMWLQNEGILVKVNALLITAKYIVKSLAYELGYETEDFLAGVFENVEEGALSAGEAVDELTGKLLSFDRFEALNKGDSGVGIISMDEAILEAMKSYQGVLDNVNNEALNLSEKWLQILGFQYDATEDLWKYGAGFDDLIEKGLQGLISVGGIGAMFYTIKHPMGALLGGLILLYVASEDFRKSIDSIINTLSLDDTLPAMAGYFTKVAEAVASIVEESAGIVDILLNLNLGFQDGDQSDEKFLESELGKSLKAKIMIAALMGFATKSTTIALGTFIATLVIDFAMSLGEIINAPPTLGEISNKPPSAGISDAQKEKILLSITSLLGGIIGLSVGGTAGSLLGTIAGIKLGMVLADIFIDNKESNKWSDARANLELASISALMGGLIGLKVGGPVGAAKGVLAAVALSQLAISIKKVFFSEKDSKELTSEDAIEMLSSAMGIIGTAIGFVIGGVGGAIVGNLVLSQLVISLAKVSFSGLEETVDEEGNKKYIRKAGSKIGDVLVEGVSGVSEAGKTRWQILSEKIASSIGSESYTWVMMGESLGRKLSGSVQDGITPVVVPATVNLDLDNSFSGARAGGFGITIQKKASGGFLEDGLFTMNHNEIAGRFSNGRTGVANEKQIASGVADAVYPAVKNAVIDALKTSGGIKGDVFMDGRKVGKVAEPYVYAEGTRVGHYGRK